MNHDSFYREKKDFKNDLNDSIALKTTKSDSSFKSDSRFVHSLNFPMSCNPVGSPSK